MQIQQSQRQQNKQKLNQSSSLQQLSQKMQQRCQQKWINIQITKIFNWPQQQSTCSFDLNFYPQNSQQPIVQKSIEGVFMSNSMHINAALKITYTPDENIVILQLIKNRNNAKELLGQFLVDLQILKQKNVQYFPFGANYVLQINIYIPMRANSRSSKAQQYSSNNLAGTSAGLGRYSRMYTDSRQNNSRTPQKNSLIQKQLQPGRQIKRVPSRVLYKQKRQFNGYEDLRQSSPYNQNNNNHYQHQPKIKKSFSQKIYSLLQQVKSMKQDIITNSNRKNQQISKQKQRQNKSRIELNRKIHQHQQQQQDVNMYYTNPNCYNYSSNTNLRANINNNQYDNQYNPQIKKSMSDGRFKTYNTVVGIASPSFRRQQNIYTQMNKKFANTLPTQKQRQKLLLKQRERERQQLLMLKQRQQQNQKQKQKLKGNQKHRLILKTLNVVPCQYFKDQPQNQNNYQSPRNNYNNNKQIDRNSSKPEYYLQSKVKIGNDNCQVRYN